MKEKILLLRNYKQNILIVLVIITATVIGIIIPKLLVYDINKTKNIPIEKYITSDVKPSAISGACLELTKIYEEATKEPIPEVKEEPKPLYDFDYGSMGLSLHEIEVNKKICDIKEKYHDNATEEICQVAMVLYNDS